MAAHAITIITHIGVVDILKRPKDSETSSLHRQGGILTSLKRQNGRIIALNPIKTGILAYKDVFSLLYRIFIQFQVNPVKRGFQNFFKSAKFFSEWHPWF